MSESSSTFDNPQYTTALIAAVVGLVFLLSRDWWMVAASGSVSVGMALLGWSREAGGHRPALYAGYAFIGAALAALVIDTLHKYVL